MATENKVRRKIYKQRKIEGYCPRCGIKKRKSEKFVNCSDCREYYRNFNQEISEKQNKKRRTLYKKRKKNNLCPRCGKALGKKYKNTICRSCLDKQY